MSVVGRYVLSRSFHGMHAYACTRQFVHCRSDVDDVAQAAPVAQRPIAARVAASMLQALCRCADHAGGHVGMICVATVCHL
eukprot:7284031-Pyramimonas_sp.AAC.1